MRSLCRWILQHSELQVKDQVHGGTDVHQAADCAEAPLASGLISALATGVVNGLL